MKICMKLIINNYDSCDANDYPAERRLKRKDPFDGMSNGSFVYLYN